MLFGGVLAIAALRYVAKGWVQSQLIGPRYHFTYPYFEYVRPWSASASAPAALMYLHVGGLFAAAVGLALGVRTRSCALLLALGWCYVELIDRATYLNHYYLVCLMAFLLACTPAELRYSSVPRWSLWVLRLQVAVVYVFAGIAKLNSDWLFHAQPLRIWLAAVSGSVGWLATPACAFVASWAGAAFDLCIVPALLWRRTRTAALCTAVLFHVTTGWLFPNGMFPWIMLSCVTLLLPADWPRRWLPLTAAHVPAPTPRGLPWLLGVHCVLQVLVPLHHHVWERESAWTGTGFDFAWKVMIAEKAGSVTFTTRDRSTGATQTVLPSALLTPLQQRALAQDPRLIIAFARELARRRRAETGQDCAVFADAWATLNGRPAQRLIAPDVDLTRETLPAHVIVPLRARAVQPSQL
ncbi:MAG: hypothetical protein RL701_322 [Pseudomonadota bacterium]